MSGDDERAAIERVCAQYAYLIAKRLRAMGFNETIIAKIETEQARDLRANFDYFLMLAQAINKAADE